MRTIHQLNQETISKISAGEVIERPVYAVKELVENALDAGADSISIHIEESGLNKIIVIDNGAGMSREDLEICFKPHTTSKISTETDLSHIQTLGFRGEALASIAAISNVSIKSKTKKNTAGTAIEIHEGNVEKISSVGMPAGTQVTVEHLFSHVPGRKKFLKSQRTEFKHILEWVSALSLAYPAVQFILTHNGKTIFDLPQAEDIVDRIKKILGQDLFSNLLPISFEDSYIKITGFLAKPHITASNLQKQFIYINQRKVSNRIVSLAVREAYGGLLRTGAYPICLLFFSLPYETVDVNVHPRKEEVRFIDNALVADAIHLAVTQTLSKHSLVNKSYWDEHIYSDLNEFKDAQSSKPNTQSYAGRLLKENKLPWILKDIDEISQSKDLIQLHNLYLVVQSRFGIVLVDQHAAHERIIYEQLLDEFKNQRKESVTHTFHTPTTFDVSFSESETLKANITLLEDLGFAIEHFKDNTFLLHTVPHLFHDRNGKQLIREMIEDLQHAKVPKEVDEISNRMIAYLACRAAVKAGDKLTKKQCKDLLEKLTKTKNNVVCPHGRPIKVHIDLEKIDKLFKRK